MGDEGCPNESQSKDKDDDAAGYSTQKVATNREEVS
jgi:hypothetical protein